MNSSKKQKLMLELFPAGRRLSPTVAYRRLKRWQEYEGRLLEWCGQETEHEEHVSEYRVLYDRH